MLFNFVADRSRTTSWCLGSVLWRLGSLHNKLYSQTSLDETAFELVIYSILMYNAEEVGNLKAFRRQRFIIIISKILIHQGIYEFEGTVDTLLLDWEICIRRISLTNLGNI